MVALNSDLAARFSTLDDSRLLEIIDSDLSAERLNNFLNMAWLVSRPIAGQLSSCGGKDGEEYIVLLLAAHFLTLYEREVKSQKTSEYSVSFLGMVGEGLSASRYGQQALALDCSGELLRSGLRSATLKTTSYYDVTADDFDVDVVLVV
jgi:hypothetical protein